MAKLPNIHPGKILREEFLEPMGITAYRLSQQSDISQPALSEILAGRRAITPATALRLARCLGTDAEFWLNLQVAYDLEEEQARLAPSLQAIQPLPLEERWRQHVHELEQRRLRAAVELAQERIRIAPELEAIQPDKELIAA